MFNTKLIIMKKSVSIIVMAVTIIVTGLYQKTSAQTSGELLNKAIAFQDTQQKWNDYSGKVHLMTVFSDGRSSGGEVIEIQTKEGFYQCTRLASKTIVGIKNREYFREVDGNRSPDEDLIKKYNLGDENIRYYKGWHYFHFGILMELKASGLVLEDKVETVKFQGNDCLTLKFTFDANKIKNEFYKGSNWTIYIDPINYSMKGLKEIGVMNMFAVFSGILTLNGIKIPLCRTYFKNEDNSFYFVDVFMPQ
jgi:hypothetical protein